MSETKDLLDKIAKMEDDFNLPKGVKTRKYDRIKLSYYWSADVKSVAHEHAFQNWLTKEQKQTLQNLEQKYILLVNEQNEFELVPYEHITKAANGRKKIGVFIFERQNDLYVILAHI